MRTSGLRNLWNSITKTLSRSNTRRRVDLSRGGTEATQQHAKVQKRELTACETNLSAISDLTSDPREDDWPTDDSFVMEPDFSDPMSDNASDEYQTKAVARTVDDIVGSAEETGSQTHTNAAIPLGTDDTGAWPNSNRTNDEAVEMSCLNATGQFKASKRDKRRNCTHSRGTPANVIHWGHELR